MKTKTCKKCGTEKELSEEYFCKRKASKDGFGSMCKGCDKRYREGNKEKRKEYCKNNKEKFDEYAKQYRESNKEKTAIYMALYSKKYKEENKEKISEYRKNNKEKNIEYANKYRDGNKEKVAKNDELYRKNNLEYYAGCKQRYRSLKKQLPSTLTEKKWEDIKTHFNHKCCYCGSKSPLVREHFIPLSKGGEYTHNNIIPSCRSCNSSKSDKIFSSWYPKYKYYDKKREKFILNHLNYKGNIQQTELLI